MSCPRTPAARSVTSAPSRRPGTRWVTQVPIVASHCWRLPYHRFAVFAGLSAAGARFGSWPHCHGKEGVAGSSPAEGFAHRTTAWFSCFRSRSTDPFPGDKRSTAAVGGRCGVLKRTIRPRGRSVGRRGRRAPRAPDGWRVDTAFRGVVGSLTRVPPTSFPEVGFRRAVRRGFVSTRGRDGRRRRGGPHAEPLGKVVTGRDGKGALHACSAAVACSQLALGDAPVLVEKRAGEDGGSAKWSFLGTREAPPVSESPPIQSALSVRPHESGVMPSLIGRGPEMARVMTQLGEIRAGRGAVLVLQGEPGIELQDVEAGAADALGPACC